jgi:hypothetical protein
MYSVTIGIRVRASESSLLVATTWNLAANTVYCSSSCQCIRFSIIQYNRDGVCSGLHSVGTWSGLFRGGVAILNQRIKTNLYAIYEVYSIVDV